jgi:PDZ domain
LRDGAEAYGARTLTLGASGAPQGTPVPMRVNAKTGFATVDLSVDGEITPLVIDNGGSYSALSGSVVSRWLGRHPNWLHSEGGVGESNLTMDGNLDVGVPVVKAQGAHLGSLKLAQFGAIAPGGSGMLGGLIARAFYGFYSDKAGESVDGWIGGNILKSFRITLDYPNRMSYWQQIVSLDTTDLDQVGVTLVHWGTMTGVAAVAKKSGADTVAGVRPGDLVISIDGRPTDAMTRGELLSALHGEPGTRHTLAIIGRQRTHDH